jgi:hypothetical protein
MRANGDLSILPLRNHRITGGKLKPINIRNAFKEMHYYIIFTFMRRVKKEMRIISS